jgi:ankyrin repeat protein
VNREGMSALALASQRGHFKTVALILRCGALVNSVTTQLSTPLMLATKRFHLPTVRVLLGAGSLTFPRCMRGRSARESAVKKSKHVMA